ncbi:hypothetical protein [Phenylobacterium sp.]|uniref:hypothetical protein n=1 Tax=Phenylobacterium sp. TaxID=1871053 RepID=UPI00301DC369
MKLVQRGAMRSSLILVAVLLAPPVAAADPVQEARSATGACLSAILEGAPVGDIDGSDVSIRRGQDPVSCTVRVTAGEPVVIKDVVQSAIKRRSEIFAPARTAWEPGDWASRETWCNLPGRRAVSVFVSTAKPGRQPVLTATVFEAETRDARCDRDLGVQPVTTAEAEAPTADPVIQTPASAARPEAKKRWLPRLPGLGKPGLGKKD